MVLRRLPRGVPVPVPVCTVAVAALWAAVGERASESLPVWWWPVPLVLGWAGVLLVGADLIARRLPDVLTLAAYPVVAVLLGVAAVGAGTPEALARAGAGGLLWAGGYAAVRLVAPGAWAAEMSNSPAAWVHSPPPHPGQGCCWRCWQRMW
jgi:leader peptidase (prepilin peptidase)/N-methyltransferase